MKIHYDNYWCAISWYSCKTCDTPIYRLSENIVRIHLITYLYNSGWCERSVHVRNEPWQALPCESSSEMRQQGKSTQNWDESGVLKNCTDFRNVYLKYHALLFVDSKIASASQRYVPGQETGWSGIMSLYPHAVAELALSVLYDRVIYIFHCATLFPGSEDSLVRLVAAQRCILELGAFAGPIKVTVTNEILYK